MLCDVNSKRTSYQVNESQDLQVELKICGSGQPRIDVKFDGQSIEMKSVKSSPFPRSFEHQFLFDLAKLQGQHCGKQLTYVVKGTDGADLTGQAIVNVDCECFRLFYSPYLKVVSERAKYYWSKREFSSHGILIWKYVSFSFLDRRKAWPQRLRSFDYDLLGP